MEVIIQKINREIISILIFPKHIEVIPVLQITILDKLIIPKIRYLPIVPPNNVSNPMKETRTIDLINIKMKFPIPR
jgi:hypothetical protein